MTNFEKVTASPEALADLIESVPSLEGPWDDAFQQRYCVHCGAANCFTCPHEAERNNPLWWLTQEAEQEMELGEIPEINHITNFSVRRSGYESVLRGFYSRLKAEREDRVARTGDNTFTEFEALMPWLVSFLLPDKKCRAVMEYDPKAERVKFFQEDDQE